MRDAAVSKVREAMAERDVERLVVMDADNLAYLTGIQDPSGMSGVLVLEQDDVTLLVSKFYRYSLDGLPGTQFYTSREDRADRIEALELDGAVADEPGRLDADLEGTDLVAEYRATKLPFEIDAMREACDTGSKAFQELLKRFDTGMQEWGMVKVVDSTFREHHAYNAFPTIAHVNTEEPHRPPSARMAADGDLALVDLGCRVDGYCSDMTRMVPNQVSGERKELLDAVATIQEEVMERVEAGREKAELARFAEDRADALGYDVDEHYLHSLGHGVGVAIHERPMLTPSSEGVLEEGMVVTIEPGLYVPDVGGVRIEDQVVVREEGCERLTQAPRIYDR